MLDDDDQVKPSFSNFDLLSSSQRSACNPKTGEPLTTRCELTFGQNQQPKEQTEKFAGTRP
jgi:hypothetical protein